MKKDLSPLNPSEGGFSSALDFSPPEKARGGGDIPHSLHLYPLLSTTMFFRGATKRNLFTRGLLERMAGGAVSFRLAGRPAGSLGGQERLTGTLGRAPTTAKS